MKISDMTTKEFYRRLDGRIARYDLLCHPFYKAWSAGELTREDLREYALDYYHHVNAFPSYLARLATRLEESELRRAILANLAEENGLENGSGKVGRSHSEIWLDFAEGMGASRETEGHEPVDGVKNLVAYFTSIAGEGLPEEALAAFYAYESQVPRVAKEKARGLREAYAADEKTCSYFVLHTTADIYHSQVWRRELSKRLVENPQLAETSLEAGEKAARALWQALDGIEQQRRARLAA